jgi:hypothetical protein
VAGSAVTSALHGPVQAGFAQASHVGWWIVAGCGLAVGALGMITTGRWARGTAARTADRLLAGEARVPAGLP